MGGYGKTVNPKGVTGRDLSNGHQNTPRESTGSKAPSATEMGPEDRTPTFGNVLTRTDQDPCSKEINLPKRTIKAGLGQRNERNSHLQTSGGMQTVWCIGTPDLQGDHVNVSYKPGMGVLLISMLGQQAKARNAQENGTYDRPNDIPPGLVNHQAAFRQTWLRQRKNPRSKTKENFT